jgi:four helix bundle protein
MEFKFEKLDVWHLSVELSDHIYEIASKLPKIEEFNLKSQVLRATTSISLNIAEGSIGASNPEQSRYLKIAYHSLVEVIACLKLMERRNYLVKENEHLVKAYKTIEVLFPKLNAFIKSLIK